MTDYSKMLSLAWKNSYYINIEQSRFSNNSVLINKSLKHPVANNTTLP